MKKTKEKSPEINDFLISSEYFSRAFDEDFIEEANNNNQGVMQAALAVSDEVLERYYQAAAYLLEQRRWEDARDAFKFLTFLNPTVYNFWVGLGCAEQSMGHYDAAIVSYEMAKLTNPENPVPFANSYQCAIANGSTREFAELCWQEAIALCADKPEWNDLKTSLEKMHQEIQQLREEGGYE